MTLKEQIQQDVKDAMKAGDHPKRDIIRLLLAAIKQREIDERITLDDTEITNVVKKMLKQRHDSISQFQQAGRQDLVDQENFEISILETYQPEQLSEQEIDKFVEAALKETGATSIKDMGKVMSHLKPLLQNKADMSLVSKKISSALK
jgi:uncharacterized protein YqeY